MNNLSRSSFLALVFSILFSCFVSAEPVTQIFVLHSYSQEYQWTQSQHKGFVQAINENVKVNASFSIEYLDTKRHTYDETYAAELEHHWQIKYKDYKPKAIYVTDDNALLFARDHLSHIFPGVPVFFSGINNYEIITTLDSSHFTGVFELKDVTPNLKWLLSMDKDANDLVFIGDGSNTYKAIESDARQELSLFKLRTTFIVQKRLDLVLSQLHSLPGKYVFLTTIGGMLDAKGEVLSLRDIMKSLVQTGRVVISMEDGYIREGVLGGYVTSGHNQGQTAANLLLSYLNGKQIVDIHPILKSPNAWMFDDVVLKQYKIILPDSINSQAVFLNPRTSLYEHYRAWIIGSLICIALLLFIVVTASLIIMMRKNRELGVARNILQESEQSYHDQFMKNSTVMLLIDPKDGKIIDANETAQSFYGYSHDQLLNLHIFDINTLAVTETKKYIADVIEGKENQYVFQHRLSDNSLRDVEVSVSKIYFGDNPILHAIIYDVTERKHSEEKLANYTSQIELKNKELDLALANERMATAKANDMAEKAETANKAKSVFLANMSHEIRTPLNAIIGFSQLMDRDPLSTEVQKEYIGSIINAGEHLLMLLNDILELSKVEAGRVSINPTNINLHTLLEDMQVIFKEQTQSKHLQFILDIAPDLPKFIIIDENKLRQIFINLISNAIKFTDEGGIALRARIDKINTAKSYLIVEVQDSGQGISEEELKSLFKHFVQTSTGINKGSGTGLGLALSRELAILMGGNISVTSEVGKGSIFTFKVEIVESDSDKVKEPNPKQIISFEKGQKVYRVLVVDDKVENLKVVVKFLSMVGFETKEAVNGVDAIEKFEEWEPDLILMDMRMPVMDGYEATRLIKLTDKGKDTPIIAVTASSFEDEQKRIDLLNLQGHIRKPFRKNELYTCIGKVLGINYIYDEVTSSPKTNIPDADMISKGVINLPDKLLLQMSNALAVADLDLLIKHIKSIETINPELTRYLLTLANNYDYEKLQQVLKK